MTKMFISRIWLDYYVLMQRKSIFIYLKVKAMLWLQTLPQSLLTSFCFRWMISKYFHPWKCLPLRETEKSLRCFKEEKSKTYLAWNNVDIFLLTSWNSRAAWVKRVGWCGPVCWTKRFLLRSELATCSSLGFNNVSLLEIHKLTN